ALNGGDSQSPWLWTVLAPAAEQHDRAVVRQPVGQRTNNRGVADQFHDREITRRGDVVVRTIIRVAGDRRQYYMVDGADICQRPGNLLRLGEVQSDAPCVAVYLRSRRLCMRSVTASEHNRPTLLGVIARDLL